MIADVVVSTEQPFVQVIFDVDVPKMAFDRVCLIGDAAFVARPHAAAGTAKAAADAWSLAAALQGATAVPSALRAWEPGQLALGRKLLERTRRIGARSQVEGSWRPGDPELIFGLEGPDDERAERAMARAAGRGSMSERSERMARAAGSGDR